MPISAQEAMNNVFSLELKGDEQKWFDKLCTFTDYHINKHFSGKYVDISFENMFIPDPNKKGYDLNCGSYGFSFPHWRQDIVIKVWIDTYKKIGWNVTDTQGGGYYKSYRFEPNLRQLKLERILDE
jgi:hypothetical protein